MSAFTRPADREMEARADRRRGWFRRLDLIHDGATFLRRRAFETGLFGVYVHRIDSPDPGLDLHDHPWPFVSMVLRGGYTEEWCDARDASRHAAIAAKLDELDISHGPGRGHERHHGRWSVHRMPLTVAHRITMAEPGTVTLVLRGRKSRQWGFYLPLGFIDQNAYDYSARRPLQAVRS